MQPAHEYTVSALAVLDVLVLLVYFDLLATNCKGVIFDGYLDILTLGTGISTLTSMASSVSEMSMVGTRFGGPPLALGLCANSLNSRSIS